MTLISVIVLIAQSCFDEKKEAVLSLFLALFAAYILALHFVCKKRQYAAVCYTVYVERRIADEKMYCAVRT